MTEILKAFLMVVVLVAAIVIIESHHSGSHGVSYTTPGHTAAAGIILYK